MKRIDFRYALEWPFAFSESFISYVNFSIKGEIVFFEDNGLIIPLILKKKYFFKIGYILHKPFAIDRAISIDEEEGFLYKLLCFCKTDLKLHFSKTILHVCIYHPPRMSKIVLEDIGILRLSFQGKKDIDIFNNFQPQYRNIIRKAEKDNIKIIKGLDQIPIFYGLYEESMENENVVYDSIEAIKLLCNSDYNNIDCLVAYVDGKPDAALLNTIGGGNVYNLFAASKKKPKHKGSLKFLHWVAIQEYLKQNIKSYQLGGIRIGNPTNNSKLQRIADFKLRFGAEVDKGYHFVYVCNSLYYSLYKILINIKHGIEKNI